MRGRRSTLEPDLRLARHGIAALPVALDQLGVAAWVLDRQGIILFANAAGHQRLDREPDCAVELRSRTKQDSLERIAFEGQGARGEIVIDRRSPPRQSFASFAARIGLTRAQTRVGALVVEGYANASISADLGVSERTVEAHLTAIYEKARVGGRSAFQAAFLASQWRT